MHEAAEKLANMAENKNSLSLDLSEISMIDSHLLGQWGVDFIQTDQDFRSVVMESIPPKIRPAFEAEYEKAVLNSEKNGTEHTGFYDMMSHQPLLGLSTSKRRALIIDAISLAASIVRSLDISGDVLDVGCHAGVVPETLTKVISNRIDGVDPSKEAIKVASEVSKGNSQLNFTCASVPFLSTKKYSFVMAVSSMPKKKTPRRDFLQGISNLLEKGGVAMIVSDYWLRKDGSVDQVLPKQLQRLDLGFAFADILGGYENMPTQFMARSCVVLIKGCDVILPIDLPERTESDWPGFQEYSNIPITPAREKSQAFKRALGKLV